MMKRTFLLFLAAIMTTVMMAGNVTPEQALQKATQFIQNRQQTTDNGSRRAPGTKPQLTLASRVSGLYVFNVQDNGGYVIISPDDRTVPVLAIATSVVSTRRTYQRICRPGLTAMPDSLTGYRHRNNPHRS